MAGDTLPVNWRRAAYGFKFLSDGLVDFISDEVRERHEILKQIVEKNYENVSPCMDCTDRNLLPEHIYRCNQKRKRCFCHHQLRHNRRKCPNNFCSIFYHLIVDDHVEKSPLWNQADFTKWYKECTQYAKCFLSSQSPATSIEKIDCAGLLSIVINNRIIRNSVDDVESFIQSRKDRNIIFHPTDFIISDSELTKYIDNMIHTLQDKKSLINYLCAQTAIKKLEELKAGKILITNEEFAQLKKNVVNEPGEEKRKRHIEDPTESIAGKRPKLDDNLDIQKKLIEIYKNGCSTLQVSPLFSDQDKDLLEIYTDPYMCHSPYHREKRHPTEYEIKSYKDIFCNGDQLFRNIYVTGDAGVGKTSFCKRMSLLWCLAKNGGEDNVVKSENMREDIEYMKRFDFVFYVTLRPTTHEHVTEMILDQLIDNHSGDMYSTIDYILGNEKCLILLDGFDEWNPVNTDRNPCEIPKRRHSNNCVYLTTCRPHKIQTVRLPHTDIDHHILIKGLRESSKMYYIEQVVNYVNQENKQNKSRHKFMETMNDCGFTDQLSIPILAAHLVVLWFEKPLKKMSKALIFSYCLEMLFERASTKGLEFPQTPHEHVFQLPVSFTKVIDLKKHEFLLQKLCIFSYKLLFQENSPNFVLTSDQRQSEHLDLSIDDQELLCKIGILSKKKEIGIFTKQKHKISFLHRSYAEYLAALYVSSPDVGDDIIGKVINQGPAQHPLYDFLQLENFILFLSGLSFDKVSKLFDKVYSSMSDAFNECRERLIFHSDKREYRKRLESFQDMVFKCVKEARMSNPSDAHFKLEDFIVKDRCDVNMLRSLLQLNHQCTKSLLVENGEYLTEFNRIETLCHFRVRKVSNDYKDFLQFMLQNKMTLLTVCIIGQYHHNEEPFIGDIPVKSLSKLTSLSVSTVSLPHAVFHTLIEFLSDNVLMVNIKLNKVHCYNHKGEDCKCTLKVEKHTKLASLYLSDVDILCHSVPSSLRTLTLYPRSQQIAASYSDIFRSIKNTHLEFLRVKFRIWHGADTLYDVDQTTTSLVHAIQSVQSLRGLQLSFIRIPSNAVLKLDCSAHVEINLDTVTLSETCFKGFIDCLNSITFVIRLNSCIISSEDNTPQDLSQDESVTYMSKYLTRKFSSEINILSKGHKHLFIERTKQTDVLK